MADAGIRSTGIPSSGASWLSWGTSVDASLRAMAAGGFWLDEYTGTDDEKLTSAIADQQAATDRNMPPIVLPDRPLTFNQVRTAYSGLKLIASHATGQKNPELSSGTYVGPEITLGAAVSSGTSSWWVGTGSIYDVFMSGFSVHGSSSAATHQFWDQNTGTLYACEFNALSFNFMRGVFGRYDRACYFTQVMLTGSWTMNNLWETQIHIGGSDDALFMGSLCNIGTSQSAAQTGSYSTQFYDIYLEGISNTNVGMIYLSLLNGHRGLRVGGTSGNGINFHGGVYEGYKGTGTTAGGQPLRASGSVVRLDSGSGSFFGGNFGQAMASPNAAEHGYIEVAGGEWDFFGPTFYRGDTADTVPVLYQSGGRVLIQGAKMRQNETWSTRPKYQLSGVTAGASSSTPAFYCPDQSLVTV